MNKNTFSPEQVEALQCSPFIESVTDQQIKVSDLFRKEYYKRRAEGMGTTAIFRECGIGPELIGTGRISGLASRLNQFDSFEAYLSDRTEVKERKFANQAEEIAYLRHESLLKDQEIEFLKKNIHLHQKRRTR